MLFNNFYDIVIENGRVMNPLNRTDIIANVGIKDGKISTIVSPKQKLIGKKVINATGLVVAPGFIDMHAHEGSIRITMEAFVKDGRTTMIAGQCGNSPYPLEDFFSMLKEGCLINYAAHFGHNTLRKIVGIDRYTFANISEIKTMVNLAYQEMKSGALGISYGLAYAPGSSFKEQLALAEVVAEFGGMGSAHGRAGALVGADSTRELIHLAKVAKIPFVQSHLGSTLTIGWLDSTMDEGLNLINKAQGDGIPFIADIYPYDSGETEIGAAMLEPGVFTDFKILPEDIEVVSDVVIDKKVILRVGERFKSEDQFYWVRRNWNGHIILHAQKLEKIELGMQNPYVVICSDGEAHWVPVKKGYAGHPRTAGSFAKFLGYWVREKGIANLMNALYKTSTQSALHLGLSNKGRIDIGSDADITIFDPETIIDKASFGEKFMEPSEGIPYVIVNGVLTVEQKEIVPDSMAGKVIKRTWKIPGYFRSKY